MVENPFDLKLRLVSLQSLVLYMKLMKLMGANWKFPSS